MKLNEWTVINTLSFLIILAFFAGQVQTVRECRAAQSSEVVSQGYNDADINDYVTEEGLRALILRYQKATPIEQEAMRAHVIHRLSAFSEAEMPPDLKKFYEQILLSE